MTSLFKSGMVSFRGGFILFICQIIQTIISAVGAIFVARLLEPSQYGLTAVALILPNTLALFGDWGISSAVIRYVSQLRSENKTDDLRRVLFSGPLLELALGAVLSLISFSLTGFVITNIFQTSQIEYLPLLESMIEVASITIFTGSLITASQSVFIGFERMEFLGLILIVQSSLKSFLQITLFLTGYGTFGVTLGYTIGALIAGTLGISLYYLIFYKRTRASIHASNISPLRIQKTLKEMIGYGLPISVSTILGGAIWQFFNFMMAFYCTSFTIGNYNVSTNFIVLIVLFTNPISTVLFPAFSKSYPGDESKNLRIILQYSVKYTALFVIPATTGIMILSGPIVSVIFGSKYSESPLYLTLLAISYLYTGIGNLSLVSLLNGQGKTKVTLNLMLISLASGLILGFIFIPRFGILGLIFTMLVYQIPSYILELWLVQKYYRATVDWKSSAKIYLTSGIAGVTTYLTVSYLNFSGWIELAVGVAIFIIIYILMIPLVRAVDKTDLNNLREMFRQLKPIYPLFDVLLRTVDKVLSIRDGSSS